MIDEDKNTDDNRQDFGLDISVGEIVKNVFDDQGETSGKHKIDDIYEHFPSSQISGKEFFAQYEKKESDTYSVVTEDITDDENDKKKSENDFQKKEDITKTVEGDGMKEEMKEIKDETKDDCKEVIENESEEKDQNYEKGEADGSDERSEVDGKEKEDESSKTDAGLGDIRKNDGKSSEAELVYVER